MIYRFILLKISQLFVGIGVSHFDHICEFFEIKFPFSFIRQFQRTIQAESIGRDFRAVYSTKDEEAWEAQLIALSFHIISYSDEFDLVLDFFLSLKRCIF